MRKSVSNHPKGTPIQHQDQYCSYAGPSTVLSKHPNVDGSIFRFCYCVNDQGLYMLKYKGDTAILCIHMEDGVIC